MTPPEIGMMALVSTAFLGLFAMGELFHRARLVPPDVTRRFNHVAAGGIALGLPFVFDEPPPVLLLAAGFVAFLWATRSSGHLPSIHRVPRVTVGALLYPPAIAATYVLGAERWELYATAVCVLALADPAGAVVGAGSTRVHGYRPWGQRKSVEGSLAVLVVAGTVTVAILALSGAPPGLAVGTGVFTGLVVALVEGALPWGLDNIGIPLATLTALAAAAAPASAVAVTVVLAGALAMLAVSLIAAPTPVGADTEPGPHAAVSDGP